ncbi:hypothetical protein [Kribbella sp. NPDC006257]|uniref:hypothetical protein n=1 Tax=Kribbella sp. NPDC006257 TaxID=3156738 RepID=UPI0033AF5545
MTVAVHDDYVAWSTCVRGTSNYREQGTLKVLRLGTTATGVVGPVKTNATFDVHDETLGWVAPDNVARIRPNSAFVPPPRFLGNAVGPTSFTPSAGSWVPEFSISKALTTCNLTIRFIPSAGP